MYFGSHNFVDCNSRSGQKRFKNIAFEVIAVFSHWRQDNLPLGCPEGAKWKSEGQRPGKHAPTSSSSSPNGAK